MDKVTDTLQDQIGRFMVVCSVLIGVLIIVVAVSAVMIVSGIIQPISQLNQATEKIAPVSYTHLSSGFSCHYRNH